jgi:hypothetical protein
MFTGIFAMAHPGGHPDGHVVIEGITSGNATIPASLGQAAGVPVRSGT